MFLNCDSSFEAVSSYSITRFFYVSVVEQTFILGGAKINVSKY